MRNKTIIQRVLVDRLFDIEHAEIDPAKKWQKLQEACRESRVLEQLLDEERTGISPDQSGADPVFAT